MEPFVADASVAISWVIGKQATPTSTKALHFVMDGGEVHVPHLWYFELSNALLVALRRKLISEADVRTGISAINTFRIVSDLKASEAALGESFELGEKFGLTVYDAAYLELARRLALPLATRDSALQAAAKKCKVVLF
jgi:predicted nucleic acid-binding protein